jgi:hypothetical protein
MGLLCGKLYEVVQRHRVWVTCAPLCIILNWFPSNCALRAFRAWRPLRCLPLTNCRVPFDRVNDHLPATCWDDVMENVSSSTVVALGRSMNGSRPTVWKWTLLTWKMSWRTRTVDLQPDCHHPSTSQLLVGWDWPRVARYHTPRSSVMLAASFRSAAVVVFIRAWLSVVWTVTAVP